MNKTAKRILSVLAAIAICVGMMPAMTQTANAWSFTATISYYAPGASGDFVQIQPYEDASGTVSSLPRFSATSLNWAVVNTQSYNEETTVPIKSTYTKYSGSTGDFWMADPMGLPEASDMELVSGAFEGWYYDEALTQPVTDPGVKVSSSATDIKLYAKTSNDYPNKTATYKIVNGYWQQYEDMSGTIVKDNSDS